MNAEQKEGEHVEYEPQNLVSSGYTGSHERRTAGHHCNRWSGNTKLVQGMERTETVKKIFRFAHGVIYCFTMRSHQPCPVDTNAIMEITRDAADQRT